MSAASDVARALVGAAGTAGVLATLGSAVRTVVLPRAVHARLTSVTFTGARLAYRARLGRAPSYERRDRVMASFAPVGLLSVLVTWLVAVWGSYTGVLWAVSPRGLAAVVELSGSSLTTLGFAATGGVGLSLVAVSEAIVGLTLVALLITYLPSVYTAFARREHLVRKLEVRAGRPPTGEEMLARAWRLERFEELTPFWMEWEGWFIDVEETHTSFPALGLLRSTLPEYSWVTAAGAVLDGASIYLSALDVPPDVEAQLCIRAGYLSLRRVASFFGVGYPPDPAPTDPVSVRREEFCEVVDRLQAVGLPVRADRDAAWRAYAGWRVNYDAALVGLAAVTMAPYAPWSSDRSLTTVAAPGDTMRR